MIALSTIETILNFVLIILGKSTSGINPYVNLLCGLILVRQDSPGEKLCEFDGMIIHPNRKSSQVILMEAKNTSTTPSYAKKCLCEKLDQIGYLYNKDSIEIKDYDAYLSLSVY